MEKPFSIKIRELKEQLVKIINNSKMPVYVLIKVFQDISNELEQYDIQEIQKYENNKEKEN